MPECRSVGATAASEHASPLDRSAPNRIRSPQPTNRSAGKVPYGRFPQLRDGIERRLAARKRFARAGVMSPWVFCFERPVKVHGRVYHHAGAPLFGSGEHGLYTMLRANLDKACKEAGVPRLLFHDFRRSAARNFERAAVPRSVARLIGGWSDRIYSRYAIGAESESESALSQVGYYLKQRGWHSGGTAPETSVTTGNLLTERGGSRTLRRTQCPPSRF